MAESNDDDSEDEVFFDAQASLAQTRRRSLSTLGVRQNGTPQFNDTLTTNSNSTTTKAPINNRSRSLPRRDTRGRSLSQSPRTASAVSPSLISSSAVPAVPAIPLQYRLQAGPQPGVIVTAPLPASSKPSAPAENSSTTTATTSTIPTAATPLAAPPRQSSRSPSIRRSASPRDLPGSWDNAVDLEEDPDATQTERQQQRELVLAPDDQRSHSSSPLLPSPTNTTNQPPHQHVHTLSLLERRALPDDDQISTTMSTRTGRSRAQRDLFLELADDQMPQEDSLSHLRRSESRFSTASKRRSLPADVLTPSSDCQPSTGGNPYARPSSRLHGNNNRVSTDLQRHMDQYRSPTDRASLQFDSVSVSGRSASGRAARRFSVAPERSPVSPSVCVRSPDISPYVRGRQSLNVIAASQQGQSLSRTLDSHEEESPAESSETKHTNSTSAESQTADTVWDELDDLKTRIKQLELTGKMPEASSATASGDSSDRPRTATTAPTTIDSSPKHERKKETNVQETPTPPPDGAVGASSAAKSHQPLQAALKKAKSLLDGSLFTTLEATVNDALQLAAMAGAAGGQNALITDRQVRRKTDTMCRNLTDLCLALCEGKHESPELVSSPTSMDTLTQNSPSLRYSSSNLSQRVASIGRPMSRLEARRSSILGVPSGSVESTSPRGSIGETSVLEQDSPTIPYAPQRRISRAPSTLLRSRVQPDDMSGDDEPTLRPPSRAMTDIGALRKARNQVDERSPGPQRTPSLRESLVSRRMNESAYETNRTPHSADSRRRRIYDQVQSTPPVLEEEGYSDYQPSSEPQRRITSSGHFPRHSPGNFPSRTASLNQRRQQLIVE